MSFSSLSLLSTFVGIALSSQIPAEDSDWILTPHGLRPKKCVIGIKSNNHRITNGMDGLTVEYLDTKTKEFYPVDADCVENAKQIGKDLAARRAKHVNLSKKQGKYGKNKPSFTESSNNNNNDENDGVSSGGGWEIDGAWWTPSLMGYFESWYQIPSNTPGTNNGQILFYFIGSQDNSDGNTTIIQPVATYAPNGNGDAAPPGWSATPWNCCPSGLSNYGTPLALSTNAIVDSWIYSNYESGEVLITVIEEGGSWSQLVLGGDYRQFNWIDVTGEFYWDVGNCDELVNTPFYFNNFTIWTLNGQSQVPSWDISYGNEINGCNPSLTFTDNNMYGVMTAHG